LKTLVKFASERNILEFLDVKSTRALEKSNCPFIFLLLLLLLFILIANGFLPGGSGNTIRHNTQISHITQNNIPHSNKHSTQNYTNNKGHTAHNEYNANTSTTTTNTIPESSSDTKHEAIFLYDLSKQWTRSQLY
jgi:hypothetical protein